MLHARSEFLSPPPFVLWDAAVKWTAKWLSQSPPKQEILLIYVPGNIVSAPLAGNMNHD